MARLEEEFYCGECKKYFITYLRHNMNGQYTVVCPNEKCKHTHHRVIKNGLVTSDRCNNEAGRLEKIIGLASTLSDTPWMNEKDFRNRRKKQREALRLVC